MCTRISILEEYTASIIQWTRLQSISCKRQLSS